MLCCLAATASAQVVVSPYVTYYAPAPAAVGYGTVSTGLVTSYYPTASVAAPVAVPYTSYYAPVAAPYTSYYAPAASPYVAYSPVVAPAPYVTYSPTVMTSYYGPAVVPTYPVVVRTKVYVPGEPVRNFFRAITP